MIATPLSTQEYFPAMLSNGRSSILIDYTGANFNGKNGHSHLEQNQGTVCGWYKPCHVAVTGKNLIQPVFQAGIQVNFYRAAVEPQWYEQEFFPKTATVMTKLKFAGGLELSVENFLTDGEIWCQSIEVLKCPATLDVQIGFALGAADMGDLTTPQQLPYETKFQPVPKGENCHGFTYFGEGISGGGFLLTEKPYDIVEEDGGLYTGVKEGMVFRRVICALDESDGIDWKQRLESVFSGDLSYDGLKKAHEGAWAEKFGDCSLVLPEQNIQELYDLSRYVVYACQHPDSGGITTGPLPHLWGGGLYCAPDALHGHLALLSSGNLEAGRCFLDFYLNSVPANKKVLSEYGFPGVTISGWDDCRGNSLEDFLRFVTVYKPYNGGLMIAAIYHQWCYQPDILNEEMKSVIRDVLAFWDKMIIRRENGKIYLVPVEAGSEGGFMVNVDTFIQMTIGKAMWYAGEMLEDETLKEEGNELISAVEQNRVDGVLMPFDGAFYTAGCALFGAPFDIPAQVIDIHSIDVHSERGKTPFGYTLEQTTEEYRHWPWSDSLAAFGYTRRKAPEKAMARLRKMDRLTSSLGALPEKWRLDGYIIGHWYMTPHAVVVWALNDAMAHCDRVGELRLLQGVTTEWQDFKANNIPQPGGFTVSLEVKDGELSMLKIQNNRSQEQTIRLEFNSMFGKDFDQTELTLGANETFTYQKV